MGNRVCAWCKKILGKIEDEHDTHGMCPECFRKAYAELAGMALDGKARLVT